jgi:hypothetical protein
MDAVDASVGLCATCWFRRTIAGARSTFILCQRSFTDPQYPRYPRLPVTACSGYAPLTAPADLEKHGKL